MDLFCAYVDKKGRFTVLAHTKNERLPIYWSFHEWLGCKWGTKCKKKPSHWAHWASHSENTGSHGEGYFLQIPIIENNKRNLYRHSCTYYTFLIIIRAAIQLLVLWILIAGKIFVNDNTWLLRITGVKHCNFKKISNWDQAAQVGTS